MSPKLSLRAEPRVTTRSKIIRGGGGAGPLGGLTKLLVPPATSATSPAFLRLRRSPHRVCACGSSRLRSRVILQPIVGLRKPCAAHPQQQLLTSRRNHDEPHANHRWRSLTTGRFRSFPVVSGRIRSFPAVPGCAPPGADWLLRATGNREKLDQR